MDKTTAEWVRHILDKYYEKFPSWIREEGFPEEEEDEE